jgi:hypothetical protein
MIASGIAVTMTRRRSFGSRSRATNPARSSRSIAVVMAPPTVSPVRSASSPGVAVQPAPLRHGVLEEHRASHELAHHLGGALHLARSR